MSEPTPPPTHFELTPKQLRLRTTTAIVLVTLMILVGLGVTHPFFRTVGSPSVLEQVRRERHEEREREAQGLSLKPWSPERKAVTTKLLLIYIYWSACFLLVFSLVLLAWLYMREIRRQFLQARSAIFREMAEESLKRRQGGRRDEGMKG